MQRVIDFVAKGKWVRVVSKQGQVSIQGQRFSIGKQYQRQQVTVKLDATTKQWIITGGDETVVAKVSADLNEEWLIRKLSV